MSTISGRTARTSVWTAQALIDGCVAMQAERKIPMNYANRYRNSALADQSYLPFKVQLWQLQLQQLQHSDAL